MDLYLSIFQITAFRTRQPLKQHVFLEVLVENKAFYYDNKKAKVSPAMLAAIPVSSYFMSGMSDKMLKKNNV